MERFLLRLSVEGLARVERTVEGSRFLPLLSETLSETVSRTASRHLGSTTTATALDNVPRYGEADVELIRTANVVLLERGWETIKEDNRGSLAGASKILKVVPLDRARPLLEQAIRQFNPSATGGEPLRSLGHPFITRYVINEFRRAERDLTRGQLSLLFVERTSPPLHVVGSKTLPTEPEPPAATPEAIAKGRAEFERLRAQRERPARG